MTTSATLDANTLASASLSEITPPGQLIDAWLDAWFELVISEHLLAEVQRTLQKPYFVTHAPAARIARVLHLLTTSANIVPLTVTVQVVASHSEDDLVLATALSGHADFLVTGDRQLLRLGTYQGVVILTPRDFLATLGGL